MPRPTVTDMTDEQFAEYVKSGAAARDLRANLDRMFAEMYPETDEGYPVTKSDWKEYYREMHATGGE